MGGKMTLKMASSYPTFFAAAFPLCPAYAPSDEQIEEVLTANGIPLAPTEQTSELFYDCARASLDAEIFPVARNFARVMRAFNGDDIIEGLIRSLEDEPDR